MKKILLFIIFVSAVLCVYAQYRDSDYDFIYDRKKGPSYTEETDIDSFEKNAGDAPYVIGVGDTFEISVYDEPELSKIVRVSEKGNINYPFIGSIKVLGLTAKKVADKIKSRLKGDYLINPQVSVFIREHSKFYILGEVENEGGYELKGALRVIDAIAMAGGAKDNANLNMVKVVRRERGRGVEHIVDLEAAESSFFIKPLDRIIVSKYKMISVLGEVRQPQSFYPKKGMTILEAIALAGGVNLNANRSKIKVIRKGKNKNIEFILNLETQGANFILKPKDAIFVKSYGSYTIIGQVLKAGTYYVKEGLTVVDAIALAGGFTTVASQNSVRIIRKENGRERTIIIPVRSILRGRNRGRQPERIIVQDGDTIMVPESVF